MAENRGRDEEGGKGNGNSDEGGGRATATMVKMRVRAARTMVTRVVGNKEGGGNGGNMASYKDDGLVPIPSTCSRPSCTRPLLAMMTRAVMSQPDDNNNWRTRSARGHWQ